MEPSELVTKRGIIHELKIAGEKLLGRLFSNEGERALEVEEEEEEEEASKTALRFHAILRQHSCFQRKLHHFRRDSLAQQLTSSG